MLFTENSFHCKQMKQHLAAALRLCQDRMTRRRTRMWFLQVLVWFFRVFLLLAEGGLSFSGVCPACVTRKNMPANRVARPCARAHLYPAVQYRKRACCRGKTILSRANVVQQLEAREWKLGVLRIEFQ
eukprot:121806-Rhodomonas_salina.1